MKIYQLIYCSRSRIKGSSEEVAAEIQDILEASRRNNTLERVTGALIYNGEAFAQVLEGPRDALDLSYAKIRFDPRHSHVIELAAGYVEERQFCEWSMAYADISKAPHLMDAAFEDARSGRTEADRIVQTLYEVVNAHLS